ncbi:ATP-binding protein, partial [Desulfothermus sp.]
LDLFSAEEVGLGLGRGTKVFLFPNIGSYFGGDLLAGLIECQMHKNEEIALFVDVGTNAEVVLGNSQWLVACAGAAGPALEGGVSKIGKQAAPGVIDKVKYDPIKKKFEYTTIENRPPIGICGSGMIDLAAELFVNGLLDIRGKFVRDREKSLFVEKDEILYLKLVDKNESGTGEDLLISQPEIDSLIRSKAAMYTILETLAETVGISLSQISKFYVGGTFGNFINPKSAITIGMLPDLPLERFVPLGNTSLKGAKKLLMEPDCFDELFMLEEKITYIELNVNQEFMNKFSGAKFLPHTDLTKFPSVKLSNKI